MVSEKGSFKVNKEVSDMSKGHQRATMMAEGQSIRVKDHLEVGGFKVKEDSITAGAKVSERSRIGS